MLVKGVLKITLLWDSPWSQSGYNKKMSGCLTSRIIKGYKIGIIFCGKISWFADKLKFCLGGICIKIEITAAAWINSH